MKIRLESSDCMDRFDVLRRARDILLKSPLTGRDAIHGEYCPYCAISIAKGELDSEFNTGFTETESAMQLVSFQGFDFDNEEDGPLIEAKEMLAPLDFQKPFLKEDVIKGLDLLIKEKTKYS